MRNRMKVLSALALIVPTLLSADYYCPSCNYGSNYRQAQGGYYQNSGNGYYNQGSNYNNGGGYYYNQPNSGSYYNQPAPNRNVRYYANEQNVNSNANQNSMQNQNTVPNQNSMQNQNERQQNPGENRSFDGRTQQDNQRINYGGQTTYNDTETNYGYQGGGYSDYPNGSYNGQYYDNNYNQEQLPRNMQYAPPRYRNPRYYNDQRYYNNPKDYYNNRLSYSDGQNVQSSPQERMGTVTEADREIGEQVKNSLKGGWWSKGFENVQYDVRNGVVTLTGTVDVETDKNDVEKKVKEINGVKGVNNQISVQKAAK